MEQVPLVRLLSMVTAAGLEELHDELARRGHGVLRPAHGYTLQAIASGSRTASEIGQRLGMTKQGAAKLVDHLATHGYVREGKPDGDARRKPLELTRKGKAAISVAVSIQDAIEERWGALAGPRSMAGARTVMEAVVAERIGPDGELPPVRPPG